VTVVAAEVDTAAPVHNAATMNPPFKNATLFRPSQDTASRAVGFLTNTNDLFNVEGLGTQGFIKSEGLFLWASDDGKLQDINNGWWLSRIGDRDLFALNWAGDVKATRDGIQVDMTSEAMW
jgi:hypothetical protein